MTYHWTDADDSEHQRSAQRYQQLLDRKPLARSPRIGAPTVDKASADTPDFEPYRPTKPLCEAVNVAVTLEMPLLLTGEPGTGKTACAGWIADHLGIPRSPAAEDSPSQFFRLDVRSNTTYKDLLWDFDAVSYLRAAYVDRGTTSHALRRRHVRPGPLWQAYATGLPTLLLIDEIDKAPRDFPNDLLYVLDQKEFFPPEWGEVVRPVGTGCPIVVITSNSEKRLPDAFLRRCVFHHIELTKDLVDIAVSAHVGHGEFPNLSAAVIAAAVERFWQIRDFQNLTKRPGTAELLAWLAILSAQGKNDASAIRTMPLETLARNGLLIKHHEDFKRLV